MYRDSGDRGPFYKCSGITEVTLEEGATVVASHLFRDCTNVEKINWPETIVTINESAFWNCTSLRELELPSSIRRINSHAFWNCTGLETVKLPEALTTLEGCAFGQCTSLTSISIPSSLVNVSGEYRDRASRGPFYQCEALQKVEFEDGIEVIPSRMLQDCTDMNVVIIPSSVKNIGNYAFENCIALRYILFAGDEEEWKAVNVGTNNSALGAAAIYYNGEGGEIIVLPEAPVLNAETAGHKQIKLNWTYTGESALVRNFILYRSEDGKTFERIRIVSAGTTQYYDQVDFEGAEKTYYYKIVVNDVYDRQNNSEIISAAAISEDKENPVPVINQNEKLYAAVNDEILLTAAGSTDNDEIASYEWEFEDGALENGCDIARTYTKVGTYTVSLTVTDVNGNSAKTSQQIIVVDPEEESSNYTKLQLFICDASSKEAISNAQIHVASAETDAAETGSEASQVWNVQKDGTVVCIVANGTYYISVCADKYIVRTVCITADGGVMENTIGLTTGSIMSGSLTTSELTYDEIIEAGIDPGAAGNNHVYKFATVLSFVAGVKTYEIPYAVMKNEEDEIVASEGGGYHYVEDDSGSEGGGWNIGIFPITEQFALIIYGEAHWLKEMYKVELVVTNNSNTDTLEQVTAKLKLPSGLSLANMAGGTQSLEQEIGTIGYSETKNALWYVRGDEAGEYNLSASVSAVTMPYGECINQTFSTDKPLKVYAGNALHLTITAQDVAERGKDYTVKYRLENVSDKSIYNLSFGLTKSEQYKILGYGDENVWIPIEDADYGTAFTRKIPELAPGGYVEMELSTTIWFNSALELIKFSKVGAFVDIAHYLTNVSVVALEGSTTTIPYDVVVESTEREHLIDKIVNELGDKIYGDVLPSGSVGSNLIEVVGSKLGIPTTLISGSKVLLKLQQGETDHKLVIHIDDGIGTENSISNDVVRITTGDTGNAIVDVLNGTKITVEFGEVSIQAKGPGSTKIKIGVENSLGKMEEEYTYDIVVKDTEVKGQLTLTPGSVEGEFSVDENSVNITIEKQREQEKEIYEEDPYVWFDSTIGIDVSGTTTDSNFTINMEGKHIKDFLDQTAVTNLEIEGKAGNLNFSREAMETIAENGDGTVAIHAEHTDEESKSQEILTETYQFAVETEKGKITDFGEGTVAVTVPYEMKHTSDLEEIYVEHIKEDGSVEVIESEYDAEARTVSFVTTGFSTFKICEKIVHTYDKGVITKAAACTASGTKTYTCSICGQTKKETVKATGHKYVYTNNGINTHKITCSSCGISKNVEHSYSDGSCVCADQQVKISSCSIKLSSTSYTYSGTEKRPSVTVKDGSVTLTEGKHYTVSYSNNVNAGKAKVTIKACGDYTKKYTGSITKTFQIKTAAMKDIVIKGFDSNYDGKSHTVTVSGVPSGAKITYAKTKDGTYTTAKPKRTSTGITKVYYKVTKTNYTTVSGMVQIIIRPKAPSSVKTELYGYDDVKVSWNKVTGASGYNVYYKKSSAGSYTFLGRTSNLSMKKANLAAGVKYTFKIVPYVTCNGTRYASKSYKISSIYTLKKLNTPTISKYSSAKVKVKWNNISGETGYQISCSPSKTGTTIVSTYKTTSKNSGILTVKKGKTYYYKVRAYKIENGKMIYGPWSNLKSFK